MRTRIGDQLRAFAARVARDAPTSRYFDGVDLRQMRGETFPRASFIAASPNLSAAGAKVNADGRSLIGCHRLSFDRQPRLRFRQPGCLALPRFAAVDRTINRRLARRRRSRPDSGSIHRKHPNGVRLAWMDDHRKPDGANALRHARADVLPSLRGTVEAVDAAVILLIKTVRQDRMQPYAMRIMTEFRRRLRQEIRLDSGVQRPPGRAAVARFEHASARHADVHVIGITRVDQDRMQFRAVGRSVLVVAAPCLSHRVLVEAIDADPRGAVIFGAKQSLRRGARIPGFGLARVSRCKPESMVDRAPAAFSKGRRTFRLVPRPTAIGRAEDGRPEMSRARRGKQPLSVARIGDAMMNDVAKKVRAR